MDKGLELLAPAGSLETFKAVIRAGADAVYVGGEMFGARAYANNFNKEELLEAIDYGHIHHRKVILAVNTLLKNRELDQQLFEYLLPYYEEGIDAVIVQDFGVMRFIKEYFNDLPIHTSTQMTITGVDGAKLLRDKGAERIVTAREMSLEEIRFIHESVNIEIESFVHGALCYCYSGQCLFSSMIGGRSGNRGRCAQPCRLPFEVMDGKKKILNKKNPYIMSLKDLNTIEFLPEMAKSGIYSYKIEGRMKSAQYAAGVVSVYRYYMDRYLEYGEEGYLVTEEDQKKLYDFGNRSGFTKGYYYTHNGTDMLTGTTSTHSKAVSNDTMADVYIKNEIKEKINGKLKLFKNMDAMIQVTDGVHQIEVTGSVVQQAKNHPLTKEQIEEKITRTGNTQYMFENLDIQMDHDIFMPVADLNHMRQVALTELENLCLQQYRRNNGEIIYQKPVGHGIYSSKEEQELIVSIECRDCLKPAMECQNVTVIYLDSTLYDRDIFAKNLEKDIHACKAAGKKVFYIMPAVFRKRTRDFYLTVMDKLQMMPLDGFLVKSYDELAFLKSTCSYKKQIRLDHNMYTYSDYSKEAFMLEGAVEDTVPMELNRKEILHRDNHTSELLIYGYLPLMISAGCIHKNTTGCDRKRQMLYLQDRYGVSFPVKNNCSECYNIIYNSKPLFLLHHKTELEKLEVSAYRIHFALEKAEDARHILEAYQKAFRNHTLVQPEDYLTDYTNGHFKRGVE